MIELDHLFITTPPNAPGIDEVLSIGLIEGSGNVHPGQGTANQRIFFRNTMLEFLWLTSAEEALSPPIRRTHLRERCDPNHPACPFGLCFRATAEQPDKLPFETWPFRPPYLPEGVSIPVATNSNVLHEPMVFYLPFGGRPDAKSPEKQEPLDHPAGLREITGLRLLMPLPEPLSPTMQTLVELGLLAVEESERFALQLKFDQVRQANERSFASTFPLAFRW